MTFSATDAAFEGFRVVRRHPTTVLWWTLAYVVVFVVGFLVAGPFVLDLMAQGEALQAAGEPTFEELAPLLRSYGAIMGLILPFAVVAGSVLNAAVARAVVRPGESDFGFLRLGQDEVKVLVVTVVLGLVVFAAYMGAAVLVGIASGIVAASGVPILWVLVVLLGIAGFVGVCWLMLRLSLAVPIVVAERRWAFFDSFALTKGKVLPLLGMTVIAFIMTLLVSLLGSVVAAPIFLMTGSVEQITDIEGMSVLQIGQAYAGPLIAWGLVNALLSALQLSVMYAPYAAAYQDLRGRDIG